MIEVPYIYTLKSSCIELQFQRGFFYKCIFHNWNMSTHFFSFHFCRWRERYLYLRKFTHSPFTTDAVASNSHSKNASKQSCWSWRQCTSPPTFSTPTTPSTATTATKTEAPASNKHCNLHQKSCRSQSAFVAHGHPTRWLPRFSSLH